MHARLESFLGKQSTIYDHQFGFRKLHSCEHALLAAQSNLLEAMNKKQIALLLLVDFSKAFDMVDHDILLNKLDHYGIRGKALNWLSTYLKGRKQYVHVNGTSSEIKLLEYGVPQGSILGPLLFVIYINDLPHSSELAKFILYADDANIIITGDNELELQRKYNILTTAIEKWVNTNGLLLNVTKTKYMIFSNKKILIDLDVKYANKPIERKTSAKFLGVLINENLNWNDHIAALRLKMSRNAGILFKVKGILPIKAMKTLYHCFIHSHLNYCSTIWGLGSKSSLEPLFIAQKRAIRSLIPGFVNYFYNKETQEKPHKTKQAFNTNSILTVHNQVLVNSLTHLQKIILGVAPTAMNALLYKHSDPSTISNRNNGTRRTIPNNTSQPRLQAQRNYLFYKAVRIYKEIYDLYNSDEEININSLTIKPFKRIIKEYLMAIHSLDTADEWTIKNFRLYDGTRKSVRIASLNQNSAIRESLE